MARLLLVCCHPNQASYTHAVAAAVREGLAAAECEVEVLDLYAEGFDPVLVVDEQRRRRDLDKVEYTQRYREQLARCDALVFVFPVWWGGMPAMLKGYLDRVFVSGLTYSFKDRPKTAVLPTGLMRGREAHFFYTLDSPWWVALIDPGWFSARFTVFQYCGFGPVHRYYLSRLKLTSREERERWLLDAKDHAERIGRKLRAR